MTARRKMARSRQPPKSPGDGRAGLILVVEDDTDTRELYVDYLTYFGFRVVAVPDGVSAVAEASDLLPDLIVMDLALPYLDGWDATRQLKSQPRTARIPIVACTADAYPASAERALVAGCDVYLVKPCTPEELLKEIRRVLKRQTDERRQA